MVDKPVLKKADFESDQAVRWCPGCGDYAILAQTQKIFPEIITEKEDFYKIKTELEKKVETINYSSIEWRPINYVNITKDKSEKIIETLTALEELDDVQNIFTNANLKNIQ